MNKEKLGFKIFKEKKLIGLFVAGLGLSFVIFGPLVSKLKTRTATNKVLELEHGKLTTKLEFLEGIDRNLIGERVQKMEQVFPSKKPVVALMGSLSKLSGDHNLSFGGITLRPGVLSSEKDEKTGTKKKAKKTSELYDLKFGFQVIGTFEDVASFMKDLEKVAPLMKIDELGLSIKTNPFFEDEALRVVAEIDVLAYYQAPPESLGSVNKPVELLNKKDEALLNKLFSFKQFEVVVPVAQTGQVDLFSSDLFQGLTPLAELDLQE